MHISGNAKPFGTDILCFLLSGFMDVSINNDSSFNIKFTPKNYYRFFLAAMKGDPTYPDLFWKQYQYNLLIRANDYVCREILNYFCDLEDDKFEEFIMLFDEIYYEVNIENADFIHIKSICDEFFQSEQRTNELISFMNEYSNMVNDKLKTLYQEKPKIYPFSETNFHSFEFFNDKIVVCKDPYFAINDSHCAELRQELFDIFNHYKDTFITMSEKTINTGTFIKQFRKIDHSEFLHSKSYPDEDSEIIQHLIDFANCYKTYNP